ncbi:ras-related protein Rab-7L1-like [Littorina saxatilis]|uniref:Ras-related protein Rab n=1 Tax=Littorina saxatilis TaxID=31220 RepID=A0AAN9GAZ7_9CAEN
MPASAQLTTGLEATGELLMKVVVIGDVTVGKTSLIQRYVNNTFREGYKATIGVDFSLKQIQWSDVCTIKLQLWDIAGQERFASITRAYYRDADGCLLLFDVTNLASFRRAATWKEDLDSKCRLPDGAPVPCLLLANKSDLSHKRQVSRDEIRALCGKYPFIGWREISVKDNVNISQSLSYLVDFMLGQSCVQSHKYHKQLFREDVGQIDTSRRKWMCAC